jgi:hypothetical protein
MVLHKKSTFSRIKLTWAGERRDVVMAYDLDEQRLLLEITDYSLFLIAEASD